MASLKYYLSLPKEKKSPIFFRFSHGAYETRADGTKKYLSLKYFIQETIDPKYWNNGKVKKSFDRYLALNAKLQDIEKTVFKIYEDLSYTKVQVNDKILKAALDREFKAIKDLTPTAETHLVAFVEEFIKNTKRDKDMRSQYGQTLNNINEYEKNNSVKLKLVDVDLEFYNNFVEFLTDKNYAPNTIGTLIKNLKVFLNDAFKKKIPVCLDFKLPDFKKPSEDISSVYLSEDELLLLYQLDLKASPILEKTRDLFLIGAYTGFRFSDFSTLEKENFCKDNIIQKRTVKTDQNVVIPAHPIVLSILKKHGEIPKVSYQTFNKSIKEIVKAAGIDYQVSYTETRGKKSETKTAPKWQLVGSHTARRSFATNAYLSGVPTISIMKMTGHKTESSFLKYIKISLTENAKILQNHSFFTNNPKS